MDEGATVVSCRMSFLQMSVVRSKVGSHFYSIFDENSAIFFRKLIRESVEYRRKEGVAANDFVDYAVKQCVDDSGSIGESSSCVECVLCSKQFAKCLHCYS